VVELPPATRVFVSGQHPQTAEWLYITAYLPDTIARGYVQHFRAATDLPEPTATLHQIVAGDTAEGLARQQYASAVRDGHDLRYYENVLLHVNRERGRTGGNALRIADNIHITPPSLTMSPAMVTPEGVVMGGGPRFVPGSTRPPVR
jgi:hypothetical protein